jgi:hypothetical protein
MKYMVECNNRAKATSIFKTFAGYLLSVIQIPFTTSVQSQLYSITCNFSILASILLSMSDYVNIPNLPDIMYLHFWKFRSVS